MIVDDIFETYPTKVLKTLKLHDQFEDRLRSIRGELILKHKASGKEFLVPYHWIDLIKKHRGYMQKAALYEFKKLVLDYEKMPKFS